MASCVSSELSCSQLPSRNNHQATPTLFCNCRKYLFGYAAFRNISPHIELEESGIKEDKELSEEQIYTEVCAGVRVCESEGVWWRGMGGKDKDATMCTVCRLSSYLPTQTPTVQSCSLPGQ